MGTMSEWPGGSAGLAAAVQAKLRAMTNIDAVTTKAGSLPQIVEVSAGMLSLAAARTSFATQVTVQVSIQPLTYDAALEKALAEELQTLAASKAGVAKEDVEFKCAGHDTNYIDCSGVFKATGSKAASAKVSEWESKIMPMRSEFQQRILTQYKAKIPAGQENKLLALVGIGNVVNIPDFVDMNLVIHGVDYSQVSSARKRSFLKKLTGHVQTATNWNAGMGPGTGGALINAAVADIRAVFTATSASTLNVLIRVPVASASDAEKVELALEQGVATNGATNIKTVLQAALQGEPDIEPVSTWTKNAVTVKLPGEAA